MQPIDAAASAPMMLSGMLGHEARHAIARLEAEPAEILRQPRDIVPELGMGEAALHLILAPEHDRVARIATGERSRFSA